MPYQVTCEGCGSSVLLDCTCPPEYAGAPFHIPPGVLPTFPDGCAMADPDRHLNCRPDGPCCLKDHHHAVAANGCPGGHGDCQAGGAACTAVTAEGEDCPGGHCSLEDPDCHVCRPVTITALLGSARVLVGG